MSASAPPTHETLGEHPHATARDAGWRRGVGRRHRRTWTEHHRDKEAVQRQVEFLAALNQTTLDLLGRRNVSELLQALVERVAILLNAPHAKFRCSKATNLPCARFPRAAITSRRSREAGASPHFSWRAMETRLPVVTDRYDEDPDSRSVYRASGVKSAAVFPIVRGTECVGVLGLAREQPGLPFNADDLRAGKLLAQMAALVLDNASIHEEAVRETEARTRALRESEERFRGRLRQKSQRFGTRITKASSAAVVNSTIPASGLTSSAK